MPKASTLSTSSPATVTALKQVLGVDVLEAGQVAGMLGFSDKATMDADLAHADGTLALVTNDATAANNGTYRKSGASGAGSWVLSEDRVTALESDVATVESETANYRAAGDPIQSDTSVPGYAWTLEDDLGRIALGVKDDGTVAVDVFEVSSATIGDATTEASENTDYVWTVEDADGNVALGVRNDGTTDLTPGPAFALPHDVDRFGGRFSHQLNYINGAGQSLAYSGVGAVQTTAQEYDNLRFDVNADTPTAFKPAYSTTAEDPTFGTVGHIKELIAEENGIAWQDNDYQLVATNNGVPGKTIAQLSKGGTTGAYEDAISQVQAGYDIATADGLTFAARAMTWTQGEADAGMAAATYRDAEISLIEDFNTDCKAITGQTQDVVLISYQTGSNADKGVAVGQWMAAMEHPLIYMATPMYQFTYADAQHIVSASSKWLGGYYGLVYKRVVIDGREWEPLQPLAVSVVGKNIDVVFNKGGLTLDTTLMPAQTNYGFSVDNGGVAETISSVTLMPGNRVRLTMANTPAAGWKVRYGHNSVTGKSPYVGGGGNLRDRQGDFITYAGNPMHNWCVIFDWEL